MFSNKQSVKQNICLYKGLAKQKKKAATVTEKDQGNYVDSSRNTAVNLDSKELSKTLKKIKTPGAARRSSPRPRPSTTSVTLNTGQHR